MFIKNIYSSYPYITSHSFYRFYDARCATPACYDPARSSAALR